MTAVNTIPEKLINAKVYREGNALVALADVDLPEIEYLSESISGSGVAGEFDSPTIGHLKPMKAKFKFRAVYGSDLAAVHPDPAIYDIRASVQALDAGLGEYVPYPVRVVLQAMPLKKGPGKMEPGKKMDSELELSCTYCKIYINGSKILEIDVLNFIFIVNGVDALATVREHLGMDN